MMLYSCTGYLLLLYTYLCTAYHRLQRTLPYAQISTIAYLSFVFLCNAASTHFSSYFHACCMSYPQDIF